ncbi:MAG: hypothetical protein C0421_04860 [Hyphomonas sp.]|uniref:DUF4345 domain-containing protein n=1 Tax=Hyphomonas sp. TaxID=87 RepID=UPI0025B98125|nr:DUF4345 domain-containing protein [Hyphomonas sp.]MBA4338156.1 hypothetical protein [Hyphomonas sp.]
MTVDGDLLPTHQASIDCPILSWPAGRLRRAMAMRIAFSMLGFAALMIGGLIFVIGPVMTGELFAALLRLVVQDTPPLTGLDGPNVDSELRFYAVLWMAYGGTALWVARAITERMRLLRLMLLIFWFGGVGRLVSYFAVGAPHPLFILLMWIEIALPLVLLGLSYRRDAAASS